MPELPDIEVYVEALKSRVVGRELERVRLGSPFLVRSVDPPIADAHGGQVADVRRVGKRIAIGLHVAPRSPVPPAPSAPPASPVPPAQSAPPAPSTEPALPASPGSSAPTELWLVIHLMIAGRLRWREAKVKIPRRLGLAAFDFSHGSLLLTEAGTRKRASLHAVWGSDGLTRHDPGGLEPLTTDRAAFGKTLTAHNHTLKRALTDPRLFAGIGNAYSDEILHRARLSPVQWTTRLEEAEIDRLFEATRHTLKEWTRRLSDELDGAFPEKVTAFHPKMAVHGRYGEPCPDCGAPVQRIRYADRETNYCAPCQTGGKVLADRSLSRLLGKDWPRTLEALERLRSDDPAEPSLPTG